MSLEANIHGSIVNFKEPVYSLIKLEAITESFTETYANNSTQIEIL
jgi:hypothetical protein